MQVSFKICAAGAAYVMATLPVLSQHPWNHAKCYPHLFGLAGFSNLNSTTCPWPCWLSPIVLLLLKFTNLLPKPWHLFFLLKEHSTPWHGCPSFFRSQLRCHHPHKRGDICIPMADACWGLTENNKILQSNYPSIKKIIKKDVTSL